MILPDNDPPGQDHADQVGHSLVSAVATVKVLELPDLQVKEDVSDWLDSGGTIEALQELAAKAPLWRPDPEKASGKRWHPYTMDANGIVFCKATGDGPVEMPATNFAARITAELVEDDGAEQRQMFEIEAQLGRRTVTFAIPANQFGGMNWPLEHLGARALVYPGFGLKDHARAAIQLLSDGIVRRTIYTHLGWRKVDAQWIYLHAGGAIGPEGPVADTETAPGEALKNFVLPEPPLGKGLREAVRVSFALLEIARLAITLPLLAATYRAPLGESDFSIGLAGPTGVGKTELAALVQQHNGPGLDARHLPANWSSTGNALEVIAFAAKDAILVVDDFSPSGSMYDVQRYHREADRLLRGQGNLAGGNGYAPIAASAPRNRRGG